MSKKTQDPKQDEVLEDQVDQAEEGQDGPVDPTPTPRQSPAKNGPNKRRPQDVFRNAMQAINSALADRPGVIDIIKVKRNVMLGDSEALRDVYTWADRSKEGIKVREQIKVVLNDAWQSGALNYTTIAKALRVESISIQALLDRDFIEAQGL